MKDVLYVGLVARDLLHEEDPIGRRRLEENSGCDARDLVLSPSSDSCTPRPCGSPRGERNSDSTATSATSGAANRRTGRIHANSEEARAEPDHHFRFPVAARQSHQNRDEQRQGKQHGQVVECGEREQARPRLRRVLFPTAAWPSSRMSCVVSVMANNAENTASARFPNSRSKAR